ncbi:EAL domain-containing response regulator [Plesiomonas sp.]|uniref:EAL domain-containing response regulator n=1 Tax=Plesiomonas sp. TaxID=2486279 RepID=UPI003F3AE3D2
MNKPTIAVIDDNIIESESLQRKLQTIYDVNVIAFSDLESALHKLPDYSVDAVLCDIHMQKQAGAEFLLNLNALYVGMPNQPRPTIIWLSSTTEHVLYSHQRLAIESGFHCPLAISKPLQTQHYQSIIRAITHQKKNGTHHALTYNSSYSNPISSKGINRLLLMIRAVNLVLQPKIALNKQSIIGAEALARFSESTHLSENDHMAIIADIETHNLDNLLFMTMLDKVIKLQCSLIKQGVRRPISINASAKTIASIELVKEILQRWFSAKLPAQLLTIELTENSRINSKIELMAAMNLLRNEGVGISLDDYGIGISSLKMLSEIPFTELKLDKSFIANISESPVCYHIVKHTVDLCAKLNISVVAEGVESNNQQLTLQEIQCPIAQGYHFYKPMLPENYLELCLQ